MWHPTGTRIPHSLSSVVDTCSKKKRGGGPERYMPDDRNQCYDIHDSGLSKSAVEIKKESLKQTRESQ